ncbi:hypothetical protein BH11PSE2_BH11PSE2_22410 [soil metagenome]
MIFRHTVISREEYAEAFALILAGIGLFRLGFFTLQWRTRTYGVLIAAGYLIALPLTIWLASRIAAADFHRAVVSQMSGWAAWPRIPLALAHASVILLMVRAGALPWLTGRLAAVGRMALSNYLSASLIGSIVYCGYGFGLFGHVERWQLYITVAAIWAANLAWSKPWLERFNYGPAEWLWRSLVQWKLQPMRKGPIRDHA